MDSAIVFMEIVLINILLSGDNAIVIAMASQQLPKEQRKKAIWWGVAAAVALRCALTAVALTLLQIPYLQAIGAVLLLAIAVKLLADAGGHQEHQITKPVSLGAAVWTIITADFIMSLDNVLAIAAVADGDLVLILLGIALSIPMIIWGSQMLGALLQRLPILSYLGAGLLAYAAGDMLMNDPGLDAALFHGSRTLAELIPLLCIPAVIILSLFRKKPA